MKNLISSVAILVLAGFGLYAVFSDQPVQSLGSADYNRIESGVTNNNVSINPYTTSTVLAANSGRVYAAIINEGTDDIYLALGTGAAKAKGIMLSGKGASYEITPDNLYIGQITAIASTTTSTLTLVEK